MSNIIKPEDLRHGNKLLYHIGEDGIEWGVTTIDWQDIKWCSEKNENFNKVYRPIPLTEKVLTEWCGFKVEEMKTSKYWWCYDYQLGRIRRRFYIRGTKFYMKGLEYLHQLQNLHFSLTGQELPVNPGV